MNKLVSSSMALLLGVGILVANSGCDWSSGGGTGSFNTSQGAGVNLNFSGVYRGELSGGKVVDKTSGGNIQTLTISQVGNSLTVIDNQGSRYTGSVGSPGLAALPDGTIPAGAEFLQSQVNFSGKDGVSARDIEFVGIIHAISVTDIQGKTTVKSSNSGSTNFNNTGSSSSQGSTTTRTVNNGDTTTTETILTVGSPGDPFYQVTTTTVVTENATGVELSRNTTTTGNSGSNNSSGSGSVTTETTTFSITEANTQYRLEGTWIEQGGFTSGVKARSPGSAGSIQTTETETTTTP
jgi:hypothetical protein